MRPHVTWLLSIVVLLSALAAHIPYENGTPLTTTGTGVHSRHQPTVIRPNATLTLTDLTGYQSAGVYIGGGLILTSWQAVAGERLLWNTQGRIAAQLRYQLPSYLADETAHSWEKAIGLTLCRIGDTYQVMNSLEPTRDEGAKSDNRCISYNLAKGMVVTRPIHTASVPIRQLLYADRTTDIALLKVDNAALLTAYPELTPARLDGRPLHRGQTLTSNPLREYYDIGSLYSILNVLPSIQSQPQHGTFDGSSQQTAVVGVRGLMPERLGRANPPVSIGQGYYSADGGLVGLHWGVSPDRYLMFTPTTEWYNDLWQINETLRDEALAAALKDALVPDAVAGLNTIGDQFSTELGNTGYDVLHYNLSLTIDPFSLSIQGTTTLTIKATYHHLASITLDLRTMVAENVTVSGDSAKFIQYERKLLVEFPFPLEYGATTEITISYGGVPVPTRTPYSNFFTVGLEYIQGQPRMAFVNQPDGANTWFPCNDHPLDRATYEFHITVPTGLMAIANGIPNEPTPFAASQMTYHWRMDAPMATNLAVVAVGDYSLVTDETFDSLTIRNYAYTGTEAKVEMLLSSTDLAFYYLQTLFGPYPFDSYGHVVTPLANGAVETQTMTIMPRSLVQADSEETMFTLVVHELAHQWYGDTVTLRSWRDIWLNEGFATYAEWLALELRYGEDRALSTRSNQERAMRGSRRETPLAYPTATQMFDGDSYVKGAWVLHMLREALSSPIFFEVLNAWAVEYADYPVTTWDFFRLAEQISGQDLTQFRRQWLESPSIPQYQLVWGYGKRGLEIATCNQRDVTYDVRLPVEVQGTGLNGEPVATTVYVELDTAAAQQFQLGWAPSSLNVDVEQQVLENTTTLYTNGQVSCLLATS